MISVTCRLVSSKREAFRYGRLLLTNFFVFNLRASTKWRLCNSSLLKSKFTGKGKRYWKYTVGVCYFTTAISGCSPAGAGYDPSTNQIEHLVHAYAMLRERRRLIYCRGTLRDILSGSEPVLVSFIHLWPLIPLASSMDRFRQGHIMRPILIKL